MRADSPSCCNRTMSQPCVLSSPPAASMSGIAISRRDAHAFFALWCPVTIPGLRPCAAPWTCAMPWSLDRVLTRSLPFTIRRSERLGDLSTPKETGRPSWTKKDGKIYALSGQPTSSSMPFPIVATPFQRFLTSAGSLFTEFFTMVRRKGRSPARTSWKNRQILGEVAPLRG